MSRGNRGEDIFITDGDRVSFLDGKEIGEIFGVYYSPVSRSRARLKAKLKSNRKLKKQFYRIQDEILNMSNSKI